MNSRRSKGSAASGAAAAAAAESERRAKEIRQEGSYSGTRIFDPRIFTVTTFSRLTEWLLA